MEPASSSDCARSSVWNWRSVRPASSSARAASATSSAAAFSPSAAAAARSSAAASSSADCAPLRSELMRAPIQRFRCSLRRRLR